MPRPACSFRADSLSGVNPHADVERDAADEALDLDRFSGASKRWLVGGLVLGFVLAATLGWPAVWQLLDTSELFRDAAYARLYTGAYVFSILPFIVMGVIYLAWLRRHTVSDRLPTPVVIGLGVLFVLQVASIASAWGDQYTGDAIYESLQRRGISIGGRDVIERGWYAGYAAQIATGVLALAVTPLSGARRWWAFAGGWPVVIVVVWFLLGNPYHGWM